MSMQNVIREEARLRILQQLAGEVDESASASVLERVLADRWWIRKGQPFVVAEVDYLAEIGAVEVLCASPQVCRLTERGKRHLDRSLALPGVKRPDRSES